MVTLSDSLSNIFWWLVVNVTGPFFVGAERIHNWWSESTAAMPDPQQHILPMMEYVFRYVAIINWWVDFERLFHFIGYYLWFLVIYAIALILLMLANLIRGSGA